MELKFRTLRSMNGRVLGKGKVQTNKLDIIVIAAKWCSDGSDVKFSTEIQASRHFLYIASFTLLGTQFIWFIF